MQSETETLVEDLWIQVQFKKLPSIIIGVIYRHPKALNDSFEYILSSFREMCVRNKPMFIFGDINDDLFQQNAKLHKIIKITKLAQVIDKPTRITETSRTLIDVLITNRVDMILQKDVVPCPIADHELVSSSINICKPKRLPEIKTYRCLDNYSANTLCNNILEQTPVLNEILNTDNLDSQVTIFTKVMNDSINSCAPIITRKISRPPAPWIDESLKNAMKERDEIGKNLKEDRQNLILQAEHKERKRIVKNTLLQAKEKHFQDEFGKCGNNMTKK